MEKMEDVNNDSEAFGSDDKIIKNAHMSFESNNYELTRMQIDSLIRKWKVHISSEDEARNNYSISNEIIFRVNHTCFDDFIEELSKLQGTITSRKITALDVTEEYIDISARLNTKRAVQKRYQALLNKASTIEDILKIENEMRVLTEEIESGQGRLNYLDDRVRFSTIVLTIYQSIDYKYLPEKQQRFFDRLYKGIHSGWKGLVSVIVAVFYIWPLFLIAGIIIFVIRKVNNRKK